MATLEEYMAQAASAAAPAKTAVQSQIDALNGQYATGEEKLNKQYALQEDTLNRQRNQAAEASSMSAAGSGGSFGGQGNIARRKYYEQSFVPALTTLQTNKANDLDSLRQNIENQRTNLNAQLANIESQANNQALQQYWSAVEAEKQREEQRRAAAAQNAAQDAYYKYLMDAMKQGTQNKPNVGFEDWVNNYSGYNDRTKSGISSALKVAGSLRNNPIGGGAVNTISQQLKGYYDDYNKWRNS